MSTSVWQFDTVCHAEMYVLGIKYHINANAIWGQ